MVVRGRHGVHPHEQLNDQPFGIDVELVLGLQAAAVDDDIARTVDYSAVYRTVRQIVESTSFRLLETLAEAIAHELLVEFAVTEVGIRVRKPEVRLDGPIDYAGVEIWRSRHNGPSDRRPG